MNMTRYKIIAKINVNYLNVMILDDDDDDEL